MGLPALSFLEFNMNIFLRVLIWLSVGLLFFEISMGAQDSLDPRMIYFLWAERIIACVFSLEFMVRIFKNDTNATLNTLYDLKEGDEGYRPDKYVYSPMWYIDLLAIVPFWCGFFVPPSWLGWIRALRVLRMLKMFRYWRSLQIVALSFYKSWYFLKPLIFSLLLVSAFAAVIMYECEHIAQPDSYGSVWNCFWFSVVSATTVGYGDMSPITPLGRLCAGTILFAPAIFVFAAIVGTIGAGFQTTMEMEKDPTIDPLEEFRKIRRSRS